MHISWDEHKRLSKLDKHGFDFRTVTADFIARATLVPTKRGRFLAIGRMNGARVTVVFALLGAEAASIVSMRPSSRKELSYGA